MPFFEPYITKTETIHPERNLFVSVIVSYNKAGQCRPLYFRFEHPDGVCSDVAVSRLLCTKPNSFFGTVYQCEVIWNDQKEQVTLYYHKAENKWSLRLCEPLQS